MANAGRVDVVEEDRTRLSLRGVVTQFTTTAVGEELLFRALLAVWCSDENESGQGLEVNDVLSQNLLDVVLKDEGFRSFALECGELREQTPLGNDYHPYSGRICRSLEDPSVLPSLYHVSLHDSESMFHKLKELRHFVCDIVVLLWNSEGGGMKSSSSVNWHLVDSVLRRMPLNVLRGTGCVRHILSSLYQTNDQVELSQYVSLHGNNILMFLCSIRGSSDESENDLLFVLTSLHDRDMAYVETENENPSPNRLEQGVLIPMVYCRHPVLGSAADIYQRNGLGRNGGSSSVISSSSPVFHYLMTQFRMGPFYQRQLDDDYGQREYSHYLGAS